jgi:hypothetical protein
MQLINEGGNITKKTPKVFTNNQIDKIRNLIISDDEIIKKAIGNNTDKQEVEKKLETLIDNNWKIAKNIIIEQIMEYVVPHYIK